MANARMSVDGPQHAAERNAPSCGGVQWVSVVHDRVLTGDVNGVGGMQLGVVFPQTELGGDVGAVRAYAEGAEALGYDHVLAFDHVVGADPEVHTGWNGPYDVHTTFHEPMVLFGYLAGVTKSLEFVTGVIILPQRQTVLMAKQAAEVDLLSSGRFRLGIGIGWNAVEYEALGEDFTNRGKRSEEQITLMRRLWTEQSVTFDGKYHEVTGAGLAPFPCSAPSRCGSVPPRSVGTRVQADSPTAGSRWWRPAQNWRQPGPWWTRQPWTRDGIRSPSAWKPGSNGRAVLIPVLIPVPRPLPTRWPSGPMQALPMCRSTPWALACRRSTTTWPPWRRWPTPCPMFLAGHTREGSRKLSTDAVTAVLR